jgi:hypothetical protein
VWLNFSIKKQPGVKLNMPAWVSAISMTPAETFADQKQAYRICWQRRSADGKIFWRNLLTKTKSADKEHLLDNLHKKSRTSGDGKNPETFSSRTNDKCNKNVSSEPITEVLHVYVYDRWQLCSHLYKNCMQQIVVKCLRLEHETNLWQ